MENENLPVVQENEENKELLTEVSVPKEKSTLSQSLRDIWGKVTGGVSSTIEKAGNTFEANRIREELRKLTARNDEIYKQIGEAVYRSVSGELKREDFSELISMIEENYGKQKELLLKEAMTNSTSDEKEQ